MKRVALALLLVAVTGCGAQARRSSVDKFTDKDQKAVAQQVEDLASAGKRNKPDDICSNILAQELVSQLNAAGTDCATEMSKAIEDANEFNLDGREGHGQRRHRDRRGQAGRQRPDRDDGVHPREELLARDLAQQRLALALRLRGHEEREERLVGRLAGAAHARAQPRGELGGDRRPRGRLAACRAARGTRARSRCRRRTRR